MRQQLNCLSAAAAVNRDLQFQMDLTPCAATPTYARVCAKITGFGDETSETVEERDYCAGKETDVTDVVIGVSVSGHVDLDDATHKYIRKIKSLTGSGRRTNGRLIHPDGTIYEGPITITDIKDFGGDMSNRLDFSYKATFDSGSDLTVINPDDSLNLDPFPEPIWTIDGVNSSLVLEFTNDVTRPVESVIDSKLKVVANDGIDTSILSYTAVVDTTEATVTYTLNFDATGFTDFALVNFGVYTYAGLIYEESVFNYTA